MSEPSDDADDRVIRPAILWNDQRTADACAEIEAAIESALRTAFGDGRRELGTADIEQALRASPPLSVVMADRIAALRAWAAQQSGRFVIVAVHGSWPRRLMPTPSRRASGPSR